MAFESEFPLYEINDGIRRAKAAEFFGKASIPATVDGGGEVRFVPIGQLRVPRANVAKHSLDITDERAEERWLDTFVRTMNGEAMPPIDIRTAPNSQGLPINEVRVMKQGRVVDPFTGE